MAVRSKCPLTSQLATLEQTTRRGGPQRCSTSLRPTGDCCHLPGIPKQRNMTRLCCTLHVWVPAKSFESITYKLQLPHCISATKLIFFGCFVQSYIMYMFICTLHCTADCSSALAPSRTGTSPQYKHHNRNASKFSFRLLYSGYTRYAHYGIVACRVRS